MTTKKQFLLLLFSIIFVYFMMYFTFEESDIFWYLYSFTVLVGMAIAILRYPIKDELPTWKYIIFGIGYGTIIYGITRLGFLLVSFNGGLTKSISKFLSSYGPNNIWHYLLLIFIIVIGEELFWRGYVQQQLKNWTSRTVAIFISSVLFAISVAISGFYIGALAAFVVGLILGALYEWKKSMPLIIVTHEVFILLLFLVLPLN